MRIAIIGSGIAGNVVAHSLHAHHDITVFEAADYPGGHSHTHAIELGGKQHAIDTGFIVFNDWTYPHFVTVLNKLGVATQPSAMSFSVRNERTGLEYNGTSINTLFAQRRNIVRPSFHKMIRDILRFNREAPRLLESDFDLTLDEYFRAGGYSRQFVDDYLIPMGAAIWSTDATRMLDFPARYFVRFFHNHGMLSIDKRPQWMTVRGGSARYVEKLIAPFRSRIRLNTPVETVRRLGNCVLVKPRSGAPERFDHVFLACHSDQALRMLEDPTSTEREVLGAMKYQENEAVLHTDTSLLPKRHKAWAAWNYHVLPGNQSRVALTYNMNILQCLDAQQTFCVTLNRSDVVDPARIIKRMTYHHPLYTVDSVAAQQRQRKVNGVNRTFFCGAYWGFGFHEDGVVSALNALQHFEQARHAQRDLSRVA